MAHGPMLSIAALKNAIGTHSVLSFGAGTTAVSSELLVEHLVGRWQELWQLQVQVCVTHHVTHHENSE
jgi:hypothetical protein